ncbi:MAG: hypothetical protein WC313_09180 [Candidatus Kapaibacterium sp.]|jgi:hypothetical protein|nr:hypothetical protein [Candidatus Kapabacteria bacterium]
MYKFLLLLFSLTIIGVAGATDFNHQMGGHCYTVDIPDYMNKTYTLNKVASLQYMNLELETYMIIIEDSKDHLDSTGVIFTGPKNFLEAFTTNYLLDAENRKQTETISYNKNGYNYAQCELSWNQSGLDFFMLVSIVETKTHYYKVLTWTLLSQKDDILDDFQVIVHSLRD